MTAQSARDFYDLLFLMDLVGLLAHELTHIQLRHVLNDLNTSSPRLKEGTEAGRMLECALFKGVQPNWPNLREDQADVSELNAWIDALTAKQELPQLLSLSTTNSRKCSHFAYSYYPGRVYY